MARQMHLSDTYTSGSQRISDVDPRRTPRLAGRIPTGIHERCAVPVEHLFIRGPTGDGVRISGGAASAHYIYGIPAEACEVPIDDIATCLAIEIIDHM